MKYLMMKNCHKWFKHWFNKLHILEKTIFWCAIKTYKKTVSLIKTNFELFLVRYLFQNQLEEFCNFLIAGNYIECDKNIQFYTEHKWEGVVFCADPNFSNEDNPWYDWVKINWGSKNHLNLFLPNYWFLSIFYFAFVKHFVMEVQQFQNQVFMPLPIHLKTRWMKKLIKYHY